MCNKLREAMFLARWMQAWPEAGCDRPGWLLVYRPGGIQRKHGATLIQVGDLHLGLPLALPPSLLLLRGIDRRRGEVGYAMLRFTATWDIDKLGPLENGELKEFCDKLLGHVELGSDWTLPEELVDEWLFKLYP